MRSRFTANVAGDADYLISTWHSNTRPAELDLQHRPDWVSLDVRAVEAGGPADLTGTVEFVARYRDGNRMGILHEKSRFTREEGRWYYVDGDLRESEPVEKIGRNDLCPCGSGRKLKKCCGA